MATASSERYLDLLNFSTFLEQRQSIDESLAELTERAAQVLGIGTCSIMLFGDPDPGGGFRLRIFAKYGDLPPKALHEAAKVNEGIAGQVAAEGIPLLVPDISRSPYCHLARRPEDPNRSFISVPIMLGETVAGILNVSDPRDGRVFAEHDLNLAVFVALVIGKSIQLFQLQKLVDSRYAQLSLAALPRRAQTTGAMPPDPNTTAKILAKTFFKEMTRAGMGKEQIITAAGEIISLLTSRLRRHAAKPR